MARFHWRFLLHPLLPAGIGIALVLSIFAVLSLDVDNRLTRMLDPQAGQAQLYERFLNDYASDEFIVVAFSGEELFSYEALDAQLAALEAMEAIPEAAFVTGLPQIFRDRFGAEDPDALYEEMTSTPFYRNLFINDGADIAGIVVEAKPMDGPETRQRLTEGVDEAADALRNFGYRVDLVGGPLFDTEINKLSSEESMRYFPIAAIVSLVMLLALMRSGRAAFAVVLCGGASILLTLGLMAALGQSLNIVTSALPLILWVLSLASCIHVVTRFQYHVGAGYARREAVGRALDEVAWPCTLSAITTAVGFLSLMLAEVPPIRELGLWMAVGLLIALLVNLSLCPALLVLFRARGARWIRPRGGRAFHRLAAWAMLRHKPTLAVFALLFVAIAIAIPRIRPQHDSLDFLPQGSAVTESYRFVGDHLTGLNSMDVLLKTPGSWLITDYWPEIEAMAEQLQQMDQVARVISPLDFLKKTREWYEGRDPDAYRLPESREEAEQLLEEINAADNDHLKRTIHASNEEIRMTVLINTNDSRDYRAVYQAAESMIAELPAPLGGVITGRAPQMQHMERQIIRSQATTFSAAFAAIVVCLLLGLRSVRLFVAAIPPNVLPVIAIFGMMGLFGIPLNAGTVMVASIAMGIAVDDTVHVLAAFRRRKHEASLEKAVCETLYDVGPSITVTTFTAAAGFFCLSLSIFQPLQFFGILSGTALLLALITDLVALPAFLAVLYRAPRSKNAHSAGLESRQAA